MAALYVVQLLAGVEIHDAGRSNASRPWREHRLFLTRAAPVNCLHCVDHHSDRLIEIRVDRKVLLGTRAGWRNMLTDEPVRSTQHLWKQTVHRNRRPTVFLPLAGQNLRKLKRDLLNTYSSTPLLKVNAHGRTGPVRDQPAVGCRKTAQKYVVRNLLRIKHELTNSIPIHLDLHNAGILITLDYRKFDLEL